MNTHPSCPQCGTPIPLHAPQGLCPRCLLGDTIDAEVQTTHQDSAEPKGLPLQRIQNFVLVEEIARGGMGIVYKARAEGLDRWVALKVVRDGRFAREEDRKRFLAEANAAADLRHPGIVSIHQVGEESGILFYAMDWLPGGDLDTRLAHGPMTEKQALSVIVEITRAVAYAHEQGVVHRDLKPQNVLLDENGRAHVTDFGIAKRLTQDSELTTEGAILGSPSYMAPEQASGGSRHVGPAADLYAIGAILYTCLTGRPPFQAPTALLTLKAVTSRDPMPPSALNPDVSQDLNTIILKLLSKTPEDRYHGAEALLEEFARLREGRPIEARPVGPRARFVKWARRHPAVAALSVAVGVVTLAGFALTAWQLKQTRTALDESDRLRRAEQTARAPILEAESVWETASEMRSAAFSPSGNSALFIDSDGQCTIADIANGDSIQSIDAHNGIGGQALWSPDGSRALSYSYDTKTYYPDLKPDGRRVSTYRSHRYGDQTVSMWDGLTGTHLASWTSATQISAATWSPDGQQIAFGDWAGVVTLVDAVTGTLLATNTVHQAAIAHLDFAPDGKSLVTSGQGTVYQIKFEGPLAGGSTATLNESKIGHVLKVPDLSVQSSFRNRASQAFLGVGLGYESSRARAWVAPHGDHALTVAARPENTALWNLETGARIRMLKGHRHAVTHGAFSRDGSLIATAGSDHRAILWDGATGERVVDLIGHSGPVLHVAFHPDGSLALSTSADGDIRVWSTQSGACQAVLRGHEDRVYQASFSPDGTRILSASKDGTVRLWPSAPLENLSRQLTLDSEVQTIEFNREATEVVVGTRSGIATLWRPQGTNATRQFPGRPEITRESVRRDLVKGTHWAKRLPESDHLLVWTEEGEATVDIRRPLGIGSIDQELPYTPLRLWDIPSQQVLHAFPDSAEALASVEISADGRWIAAGQGEVVPHLNIHRSLARNGYKGSNRRYQGPTSAWIWDAHTGEMLRKLEGMNGPIHRIRFVLEDTHLMTFDRQKVALWDLEHDTLPIELNARHYANAVDVSGDGAIVAITGAGGFEVWDLVTRSRWLNVDSRALNAPVQWGALARSGTLAAVVTEASQLVVYDLPHGEPRPPIDLGRSTTSALAVAPDGAWIAVGATNGKLQVFSTDTPQSPRLIRGHTDEITRLVFSQGGVWLASGSEDYTARVWPVTAF